MTSSAGGVALALLLFGGAASAEPSALERPQRLHLLPARWELTPPTVESFLDRSGSSPWRLSRAYSLSASLEGGGLSDLARLQRLQLPAKWDPDASRIRAWLLGGWASAGMLGNARLVSSSHGEVDALVVLAPEGGMFGLYGVWN